MVGGRTYAEKVEGGTADDGGRSERAGVEARGDGLDHRQDDLWRRRAEGHEGEVRHGRVPHLSGLSWWLLFQAWEWAGVSAGGSVGQLMRFNDV